MLMNSSFKYMIEVAVCIVWFFFKYPSDKTKL